MFKCIYTFGEYLTKWMEAHSYTCAYLSEITHQKSQTTVSRLMHDQCTPQRCAVFISELMTALPNLDENELKDFRESVDVSRYGKGRYLSYQAFSNLAMPASDASEASSVSHLPLADELFAHVGSEKTQMLIIGCIEAPILRTVKKLLAARRDTVSAVHYYSETQFPDLTPILTDILALLVQPNYNIISVCSDSNIYASHLVLQDALILKNSRVQKLIIPVSCKSFRVMTLPPDQDLYGFYTSVITENVTKQSSYKVYYNYEASNDYIDFVKNCLHHEQNKTIYQIKPDVGPEHIPVDILIENFKSYEGYEGSEAIHEVENELLQLFEKRFHNMHYKNKPTYLFLNKTAMVNFAKSGMMIDHPFCLRPFTKDERIKIFEHLIHQAQKNPYFIPLFLVNPDLHQTYSFIGFEGYGLIIYNLNTTYSLSEEFREILLTVPELIDHYTNYAVNILIKSASETPKASIEYLKHLIQVVKNSD
ncbi:MAG: hypothetical protein IJC48_07935 [Clostridia bacterium]|nr:hypothetical protein [Clostridia bacterium]